VAGGYGGGPKEQVPCNDSRIVWYDNDRILIKLLNLLIFYFKINDNLT
jgi:hypothetical protein